MRGEDNLVSIDRSWPEDVKEWARIFNDAIGSASIVSFIALGASEEFIERFKDDDRAYKRYWSAKDKERKGEKNTQRFPRYSINDYIGGLGTNWNRVNDMIDRKYQVEPGTRLWFRLHDYPALFEEHDKQRRGC